MKPNENNDPRLGIFKTGTIVSDAPSWLDSLVRQIRELREERKNPPTPVQITAERDPRALELLIDAPSPVRSLFGDIREAINDVLHPRKIETTVAPVEVEEIWSKQKNGVPRLLSVGIHLGVLVLALVPWATSGPKVPPLTETAVMVYTPMNL